MDKKIKDMIISDSLPKGYFSNDKLSQMRAVNIINFVKWYDESLLIKYKGCYRLKDNLSVVLNDIWARDFKEDRSCTAIDFCNRYLGLNMYASMFVLNEYLKQGFTEPASISRLTSPEVFKQKMNDGSYINAKSIKQIYAYLSQTRQISNEIIKKLTNENYLYAEPLSKGYNLLFAIYDEYGEITGFERTGILSNADCRYKGCIITEEYSGFTYIYNCVPNTDTLYFAFESSIDLMSFLSLAEQGYVVLPANISITCLSLRGLQNRILDKYTARTSRIILCTDNDNAGIRFADRVKPQFDSISLMYGELDRYGVKDWNDLLKIRDKINTPIDCTGLFG